MRRLILEPLEDRQLLDAGAASATTVEPAADLAPWQNPVYRLDVNNSGSTSITDALAIVNRILDQGMGNLPDPGSTPPEYYYDTSGDNRLTGLDLLRVINGLLAPPKVAISSLTLSTADVTPQVTVTATDTGGLPNGTLVNLDVDRNGDGDFDDDGEFGHTQSTLFAGSSIFDISPALERTEQPYQVNLRVRLKDADAVNASCDILPLEVDTRTSTALEDYVNAPDDSYEWELVSTEVQPGRTAYHIDLISQTWRSPEEVDEPVWHHDLEIYVPTTLTHSTASLLIDIPISTGPDGPFDLGEFAALTQSVVVHIPSVPSQPLLFSDETEGISEDRLLAYTFDKFMDHYGEPGNETWPALLPMVKSVVRAMDTVQRFVPTVSGGAIADFVVTGYSKRGWASWLTAAVDDRVRAIMPGVFDNLNQGPQMVHHYGALGFFADALRGYIPYEIFDRWMTPEAQALLPIIDPYRYLENGRFDDLPKLLLNGTGDEFFVPDSSQFYIHDLPGNQNYLRYFPNGNHGLGIDEDPAELLNTTVGYYLAVINNIPLPQYSWTVDQDGSIHVQTSSNPTQVKLWQAANPTSRDFRIRMHPETAWTSTPLVDQGGGNYVGNVPMPETGARAYLVELTFAAPVPSFPPFVFTTEARVKSPLPLVPWPFEVASSGGSPASLATSAQQVASSPSLHHSAANAVAAAMAIGYPSAEPPVEPETIDLLPLQPTEPKPANVAIASTAILLAEVEVTIQSNAADPDDEVVDYVFGSTPDGFLN